jgi:cytochrome b
VNEHTYYAPYPVWDLPTRLFHWLLVVNFAACWATQELGWIVWHFYAGYSLLTLVLFRLAWGLIGSRHSRFSDFLRGPRGIREYLREGISTTPGHNPLGALSVIAMLGLLLVQAATGLFNADDQGNQAPYYHLLSESVANLVGETHVVIFNVSLGLIGLHLLAIVYYRLTQGPSMLLAMLRGRAQNKNGRYPPVSTWRALAVLLLCAGAVTALVMLAPKPQFSGFL